MIIDMRGNALTHVKACARYIVEWMGSKETIMCLKNEEARIGNMA